MALYTNYARTGVPYLPTEEHQSIWFWVDPPGNGRLSPITHSRPAGSPQHPSFVPIGLVLWSTRQPCDRPGGFAFDRRRYKLAYDRTSRTKKATVISTPISEPTWASTVWPRLRQPSPPTMSASSTTVAKGRVGLTPRPHHRLKPETQRSQVRVLPPATNVHQITKPQMGHPPAEAGLLKPVVAVRSSATS